MKRASACLSWSVWSAYGRRERLTSLPLSPPISMLRLRCVTERLLKSWRGLRSFARVTVCNIKTGGGKGGEGLVFVAEFLAVGKRSAFRSLPGAALRSALGCKNVAAAGGASAVQSFKRRKTKGKACCFLHVACGGERVRLLCLVSVGVGASLRRWFA